MVRNKALSDEVTKGCAVNNFFSPSVKNHRFLPPPSSEGGTGWYNTAAAGWVYHLEKESQGESIFSLAFFIPAG